MHSDDERAEDRRGERERGELRRAEVADDRGVDEQVQRLGGQRAEGGQREAQDLAVVGRAAHPRPLYDPPMVRALALLAAASLAACGATSDAARRRVHRVGRRAIERALARAPRPVTLPSGTRLSQCVSDARSDADLQNAGAVLTRAADDLAARRARATRDAALRARLPRRRRAARREAHGRDPRRAAAPHRARGRGARRRRRADRRRAGRGQRAGRGDRMKLRLYHHPDGARVAYREAGTGPGLVLAALGAAQPPRVRAGRRAPAPTASASCCPTCRCTATPRTARATPTRWTGSPR